MKERLQATQNQFPKPNLSFFERLMASSGRRGHFYLEHSGLKPEELDGKRILNAGAGGSDIELDLKKNYGVFCNVVNVDITYDHEREPSLLNFLRLPRENFPQNPVRADVKSLPFKDDSFDLAFASNLLQFLLPKKSKKWAIQELIRVTSGNIYLLEVDKRTKRIAEELGLEILFYGKKKKRSLTVDPTLIIRKKRTKEAIHKDR